LVATDLPARLQAALADRYQLERQLGRGGMATVDLARDLRHDRPVALKVLHPELAAALGPERFGLGPGRVAGVAAWVATATPPPMVNFPRWP
jgi:hypothetical protein